MTSYWPAIFISLIAHGLIIFLVFLGWEHTARSEPIKPPNYIKATLVDLKPQGNQGAPKEKPKPKEIELEKQRQAELKKQAAEKARQQKLQQQREKEQAAKAKAEKAAKIAKQKAEQEKQRAEEKKRRQEELQRQAQREREALEKQQFEESLAKERERIEAERQAEALAKQTEDDRLLAQSFIGLIQQRVRQNWSRPPSARNGMEARLSIQLVPTGEVIDVNVVSSSGNGAFDRSAVRAVKKARHFPELRELPSRVFEKDFRKLTLIFRPEDLRQ